MIEKRALNSRSKNETIPTGIDWPSSENISVDPKFSENGGSPGTGGKVPDDEGAHSILLSLLRGRAFIISGTGKTSQALGDDVSSKV